MAATKVMLEGKVIDYVAITTADNRASITVLIDKATVYELRPYDNTNPNLSMDPVDDSPLPVHPQFWRQDQPITRIDIVHNTYDPIVIDGAKIGGFTEPQSTIVFANGKQFRAYALPRRPTDAELTTIRLEKKSRKRKPRKQQRPRGRPRDDERQDEKAREKEIMAAVNAAKAEGWRDYLVRANENLSGKYNYHEIKTVAERLRGRTRNSNTATPKRK